MFPLKICKEIYYAGMGEYETRHIVTFNNGELLAKIDYLKIENIDKINRYVKSLEDKLDNI